MKRPGLTAVLLICWLAKVSPDVMSSVGTTRNGDLCDGKGLQRIPPLLSILARPGSVAVLQDTAVDYVKPTIYGNCTLSAVRQIPRGEEGWPHVVEWINEELPDETSAQLYSRPFVVGGIVWILYVRPNTDDQLSGWNFFLEPLWNDIWNDDEVVDVTLDISMPYGGKGFETIKGDEIAFSSWDDEDADFWIAFLPGDTRARETGSAHAECGYLDGAAQQHPPPHSHVLRLNFTKVAASWATGDNDPRHVEGTWFRSCQNYLSLLQWVEHHGLGELFTSSVQHRVRTRDSVVYNEYNWNGQVYDHDSWTQLLSDLVGENIRCHMGTEYPDQDKIQAVAAMFDARWGYVDVASQYIDMVQDPAVEGGVRYVDRSDGEDLALYGTVCTTGGYSLTCPCTAADARRLEYRAFYDGLMDPTANDQEQHRSRAMAVHEVLRYVVQAQLGNDTTSWGEEWHKLRNAAGLSTWRAVVEDERQGRSSGHLHGLRRTLVRAVTAPWREGRSCITQLPSEGQAQVFEWRIYGTRSMLLTLGLAEPVWTQTFSAAGLTWTAIFQLKRGNTYMALRPHGDLRRDIKVVRGTARYDMLSGHLQATGVPARTRGKGAFVIRARSPNVTLWSLPTGGPGKGQGVNLPLGDSPDMVVRLHVDASVEWREGAKGPERAVHEAAYQQLLLLRAADHLKVGKRFRRTVQMQVAGALAGGGQPAVGVLLKRHDTWYNLERAHELFDELVQENLLCLTGSKDIANTKRSAVLDMSLLRSTPHQELWRPFRALYAPKVVVLHPDPDAVYNSKKAATNSKTSNKRSKSTYASITSTRYLDQYGHDVTSYYEECTTDLDGLSFNAFDELDAESTHMGACGKADGLSVTMARWHVHAMELIYTAAVLFLTYVAARVSGLLVDKRALTLWRATSTADSTVVGQGAAGSAAARASAAPSAETMPGGGRGNGGARSSGGRSRGGGGKRLPGRAKGPGEGDGRAQATATSAAVEGAAARPHSTTLTEGGVQARPWFSRLVAVLAPVSRVPTATTAPPPPAGGSTVVVTPLAADGGDHTAANHIGIGAQQQGGQQLRKRRSSKNAPGAGTPVGSGPQPVTAVQVPADTAELQMRARQQQGQQQQLVRHASAVGSAATAVAQARPASGVAGGGQIKSTANTAVPPASSMRQAASQVAADDDDEVVCLVCHDGPRQWGFLHGCSVHVGVCGECRELVRARAGVGGAVSCPVCREHVDGIIKLIQA